jgi:hypothetical protein
MPTVQIGPLTLHTNCLEPRRGLGLTLGGQQVEGESVPAVVTGPAGLELDCEFFMSDLGDGQVHCPNPAGVPAGYERLAHGARMGVYGEAGAGSRVIRQLRLLRFNPDKGWGNPTGTTLVELDQLLESSTEKLLRGLGATDIGTRTEVLGERGNDLAMRWASHTGPELPLAAYALTRILAIYRARLS